MNVEMGVQQLPPGVEDAEKPDVCAEPFRVFSELFQSLGGALKKHVVNGLFVEKTHGKKSSVRVNTQ